MSATNWAYCPKCEANNKTEHKRKVEEWKESYGKISAEDYDANRPADEPPKLEETLREDYELWITDDLRFRMYYSASCESCGFAFRTEQDQPTGI